MTWEEAIKHFEAWAQCNYAPTREAALMALAALTPPTQEQMERVWPGCDFCKKELDDYPYIVAHGDHPESGTCYEPAYCPICGRPLTPEAWEEPRKRWEALKDDQT